MTTRKKQQNGQKNEGKLNVTTTGTINHRCNIQSRQVRSQVSTGRRSEVLFNSHAPRTLRLHRVTRCTGSDYTCLGILVILNPVGPCHPAPGTPKTTWATDYVVPRSTKHLQTVCVWPESSVFFVIPSNFLLSSSLLLDFCNILRFSVIF